MTTFSNCVNKRYPQNLMDKGSSLHRQLRWWWCYPQVLLGLLINSISAAMTSVILGRKARMVFWARPFEPPLFMAAKGSTIICWIESVSSRRCWTKILPLLARDMYKRGGAYIGEVSVHQGIGHWLHSRVPSTIHEWGNRKPGSAHFLQTISLFQLVLDQQE